MDNVPIDTIISLAVAVVKMAKNVKANKERCQRVAKRVMALQELVLKLKERDPHKISEVVRKSLNELSTTLVKARNIMTKYQQTNIVKSFVLGSAHEDKFLQINEQLDDTFQVLSGALQIEHGEVLNKVLNAVTGKNNEITQPRQPFPTGSSNTCGPSHQPSITMQMPTPNITQTVPSASPTRVMSPTPTPNPPRVPNITITNSPNPPYLPAQIPSYNPNTLSFPIVHVSVPCSMPPRVVTVPPPPVRPVVTIQGVYGALPGSIVTRTAPPVVYANAMAPQQMIMTMSPPQPGLANPGVMTVVLTKPF